MDLPDNTPVTNRSVPACTVIPVLVYEDVSQAVDWLCDAFGFAERLRAGSHRAQLIVGDGAVILSERRTGQGLDSPDAASFQPPRPNEVSHSILVQVEDTDRHYEGVRAHGARILHPPTNYPYGERQYTAEDLGGHRWTFSQSIAAIDPSEWGATVFKNVSASSSSGGRRRTGDPR